MQQEQFYNQASAVTKTVTPSQSDLADAAALPPDMPQCCGTGCTVCVLDYPELFSVNQTNGPVGGQADSETLAMLEAIEQAQLQASRLLAETGSDLQ